MATEYTPNYNLDLYAGTDKPNLRDQYNSAMGKIDAQFVNIENDHTETGNQISAINTNITQLGERVTTAEGDITQLGERVTTAEGGITQLKGMIGGTDTTLAKVKETADNALSLAQTNKSDIATNDSEIAQLQNDVKGKAPTAHASATTEYGAASTTEYGHVKASNNFRTNPSDPASVLSSQGAAQMYGLMRTIPDAIMQSISITPCGEGASSTVEANAFSGVNLCVCSVNAKPVVCGVSRTSTGSNIKGVGVEDVSGQDLQLRAVSIVYNSTENKITFNSTRISITASGISTTPGGGTLTGIYGGCKAIGL